MRLPSLEKGPKAAILLRRSAVVQKRSLKCRKLPDIGSDEGRKMATLGLNSSTDEIISPAKLFCQ